MGKTLLEKISFTDTFLQITDFYVYLKKILQHLCLLPDS